MKKLLILLLLTLGLIGVSFADDSQEAIEREIAEFEAELEAEEKPKSYSKSINAQVAKNAIRCLALSYLQTTIPENEKFSQGGPIFSKVYEIHYEEYSGENLTIGDINNAKKQAVREVAFDFSNDSYGDYALAKEFRHCAYWVYDIAIYLSNIEKDFHILPIQTEIPPSESALREKQIFLLIPTKSSMANFENDIALWDQQLFQGFKFWMDLGAPLSLDQLEKTLYSSEVSN